VTQRISAVALLAIVVATSGHAGQSAPPPPRELYEAAVARDQALRAIMNKSGAPLKDYRATISAYDALVRRYPTSGYVDNALWQGAAVAIDAFERFGEERDRSTARRMLELLVSDYPVSPFVGKAREVLKRLDGRAAAPEKPPPPPPRPAAHKAVVVRSITRTSTTDRVRVTIELDGPTAYHTEAVENPSRVLVDFADTRLGEAVPEGTLSYTNDDIVRRVRIGVHPNQVIRVVVDLDGVARYAVSTLDRPYRIVVDCQRAASTARPARETPATARAPALQTRSTVAAWAPPPAIDPPSADWLRPPLAATPAPTEPPVARPAIPKTAPLVPSPSPPPDLSTGRGPVPLARQLGLGAAKIVIDPGHGGHDPGALGQGISEAEVVLDVALRLESLLRGAGVNVVLTRRIDEYVALEERPAVATREQADLFLSIHANASSSRAARGIESYFLNFSTDPDAEAVAARENAATGRTINSLPDIVKAITLNSKLDESRSFATLVERTLAAQLRGANIGLIDHGVKQAPFVVLVGAAMPSVLVEISFITNAQEGRLLKSGAYRQRIAQALFDAVRGYQKSLKSAQAAPRQ